MDQDSSLQKIDDIKPERIPLLFSMDDRDSHTGRFFDGICAGLDIG
jgi:hypothetical protein